MNEQTKDYLTQDKEATVMPRVPNEENTTHTARYFPEAKSFIQEENEPYFRDGNRLEVDSEGQLRVEAGEVKVTKSYYEVDANDPNKSTIISQDHLIMSPADFENAYIVTG